MRIIALILLTAGLAVLADQLMHRTMLERIARQADDDPGAAAAHMMKTASVPACPSAGRQETYALARALFVIESQATSRTEHALEWTVAWLSDVLGFDAPDLSYGPGQIRPSTLRKMASSQGVPPLQKEMLRRTARRPVELFDECRALSLAEMMIRGENAVPASHDGLMPRDRLIQIARSWNGQESTNDVDAIMAGLRYQRLVYAVFQRLRFETLHQ